VHCHSPWATGYASAGIEIPCLTVQTIEKIGRMPLIPLSPNGGPQTEAEISPVFEDRNHRRSADVWYCERRGNCGAVLEHEERQEFPARR